MPVLPSCTCVQQTFAAGKLVRAGGCVVNGFCHLARHWLTASSRTTPLQEPGTLRMLSVLPTFLSHYPAGAAGGSAAVLAPGWGAGT
jgi:hypothetical protein